MSAIIFVNFVAGLTEVRVIVNDTEETIEAINVNTGYHEVKKQVHSCCQHYLSIAAVDSYGNVNSKRMDVRIEAGE